jgi:hypothetical protein
METNTVKYITQEGERWDTIANKAWGDPLKGADLIALNTGVPVYDVFPAGIELQIPVLELKDTMVGGDELPPWKR